MVDIKASFPHNLRVAMAHADVKTAEDLAGVSGLSVYSVRNYLTGSSTPSLENLATLALSLDCTPNDLLGVKAGEAA